MRYATLTRPGSRPVNEDSLGVFSSGDTWCFLVADGLGGHGQGDVASRLAVDAFGALYSAPFSGPMPGQMAAAFRQAQEDILREQRAAGAFAQMKTTAAALALRDGQALWGHIGDSRVYAFARRRVKERTLDHSVPQMLALAGDIREKEIRGHPDRNRLLRVLGVAGDAPRFELSPVQDARRFDAFLLCSDGFWELITEKEMGAQLKRAASPEEWLAQMAGIVEERGRGREMDNYSAIAVLL